MVKQLALGSILGAIVLFVWSAWMLIPKKIAARETEKLQ
jgi:hypothetical protein